MTEALGAMSGGSVNQVALDSTPLGAPIVGRVADAFGPRWALAAAGLRLDFLSHSNAPAAP